MSLCGPIAISSLVPTLGGINWTFEPVNKTEIVTSFVREQKGLGTIAVRLGGYHPVNKVIIRHLVSHSRPAPVSATLFRFMHRYCFVTRNPLNPRGFWALHWFGEYGSSFYSSQGLFWFFISGSVTGNRVVRLLLPVAVARPKEAKMDRICL